MSNGISQFAYTAPAPTSSFGFSGPSGPAGGTASVTLPEISVGPDLPDLGGGALPGDGSYGDPIAGFHQINRQFADGQRAFSERMDAQSARFNAQFQAQNDARAVQMQAQFESNMASMNAQRAAMFAAPPVTGPILPPNFSETAQASAAPTLPLPDPAPVSAPPAELPSDIAEALPPSTPSIVPDGLATFPGADAAAAPTIDVPTSPPQAESTGAEQLQAASPDFSAPASGDELVLRGSLLPFGRTANGDLVPAWPEFLVEIGNAVAYPGRVLNGEALVIDPATGRPTDEAILNAWTAAGLVAGGTSGFATRQGGEAVLGSGPVRVLRGAGSQGLNITEGVVATGLRAIDIGQSYEVGVRSLYGNNAFRARQYTAIVDGAPVSGVADNVALIGGRNTAVEAKFVDDWASSLRNPASPNGGQPWAVAEQRAMIDQARKYSAAFEGGAVYHTNSPELAAHYAQAFRDAGIENIRFVLTPALRPGVL